MTAIPLACVLLATAVLISPRPQRHRLTARGRRCGRVIGIAAAILIAGASAAISPALVIVSVIAGAALVAWRRRRHLSGGRHAEGQSLSAALELLIGELRVGAPPGKAFAIAGAEAPPPVGDALQAVAVRAALGADVVAGLLAAAVGSTVPGYWFRLAASWELATRHGLAISVLMRAAHRDIVNRQRFSEGVGAALAGARATAAILALLPAFGVVLGQMIGAHPIRFLLGGGLGGILLVLGVVLVAAGLVWADRIIEGLTR